MASKKSSNNYVGRQQIHQQALLLSNLQSPNKPPPPVNLRQRKPQKQNYKNDKNNGALQQCQHQNNTGISTSNGSLYYQYGRTSSVPSDVSPLHTPSSTHTISRDAKPTIFQHTQTTQYHTPLHQTNDTGINSSYNSQFNNVEGLNPSVGGGVPDSTLDATSAAPPFVHRKDISTGVSSASTKFDNVDSGIYNAVSSSILSQKREQSIRTVTPTEETTINRVKESIINLLESEKVDKFLSEAILELCISEVRSEIVPGTPFKESCSKHQLELQQNKRTKVNVPQQDDELQFLLKGALDTSTLNDDDTLVFETSYNDDDDDNDVDGIGVIATNEQSTVDMESVEDEGHNNENIISAEESDTFTEVVDKYNYDTVNADKSSNDIDSATDEEKEDTNSNESAEEVDQSYRDELGRDILVDSAKDIVDQEEVVTGVQNNSEPVELAVGEGNVVNNKDVSTEEEVEQQSYVDPLDCETVSYIHDEEEETVEEEDDDESADQQNGLTIDESKKLDKISNWIGNAAAITKVLDSLVSNAAKKKLKDEGYELAETMNQIVKIAAGAEIIGEIVASSIDEEKLSPAEIGELVKQHFEGMENDPDVIKTCLLDNTQTTSATSADSKAPIVFGVGRGSDGTNNTGTTQCRNFLEAALVLVRAGMLPKNTRLCTDYFFAHETNKDKMHYAPALWHLLWSILHVDQDVQVILAMNELKRFGRGQLVNKLLLIIESIHPDIKVVSVAEFSMHPNDVTNNNEEDILGYNSITDELGSNRGQNNGVSISDSELERLGRISNRARVRAQQFIDMAKEGLVPKIISNGLRRGREVSEDDESDRNDFKLVIDYADSQVKDQHTPLSDQPEVQSAIKTQLDELNKEYSNSNEEAVLIYLRRTDGGGLSKSVWDVSLWQLALAIEAGIEDGCITKDTELIIISEDGFLRTGELNPGLSRAMSRIRTGGVSVFIEASTLRGTGRRVVHNTLEVVSEEAGTKIVLAAQSSDSKDTRMMHAEIENKRQLKLADKADRFHETDDSIRDKLSDSSPALYRLSVFFSIMSRTYLKREYLFKEELEAAKKLLRAARKRATEEKSQASPTAYHLTTACPASLQGTGFAQDDRVRVSSEGDRVWLVKGKKEDGRFELRDESDKETIYVKIRYIIK